MTTRYAHLFTPPPVSTPDAELPRSTRVVGARVPDDLAARLAAVAEATGETPSSLLRRLLAVHADAYDLAAYA